MESREYGCFSLDGHASHFGVQCMRYSLYILMTALCFCCIALYYVICIMLHCYANISLRSKQNLRSEQKYPWPKGTVFINGTGCLTCQGVPHQCNEDKTKKADCCVLMHCGICTLLYASFFQGCNFSKLNPTAIMSCPTAIYLHCLQAFISNAGCQHDQCTR